MKKSAILQIINLAILFIILAITAIQCASPEMTSARLYISRSDWVNAENSLSKEVETNPQNSEAWYLLGFTRVHLQNYDGMLYAFEKSLSISKEYEKKINDAKRVAWAQTLNAGIGYHNRLQSSPPESISILSQHSIDYYKMAIRIAPDSVAPYQNIAALYGFIGNIDEQINYLKKARALKDDPQFTTFIINAYLQKGEELQSKGNQTEASSYFDNAILELQELRKKNPEDQDVLGLLINVYIAANRAEEAMPLMIQAVQKNPNNKIFQNNLGLLYMKMDSLDKAISYFDAALAIDDKFDEALRNCAIAYMRKAEKIKESLINESEKSKKNEANSEIYINLFKKSAELFKQLVSIHPDDPNLWDALATAYGNSGMFKEAKQAIEQADKLRKTDR